ncbi:uncharacterized protein [Magallana gigas]|uniref:uncharacterized protein isoform X3 n=1 Tax=Magallana gigas TaxID=29159 RepID=UPI0033401280
MCFSILKTMSRKDRRVNPIEESRKWSEKNIDPPGFNISLFENKGRGVRTNVRRNAGDFLLVYTGKVITKKEGENLEEGFSSGYRFFFTEICDKPSAPKGPFSVSNLTASSADLNGSQQQKITVLQSQAMLLSPDLAPEQDGAKWPRWMTTPPNTLPKTSLTICSGCLLLMRRDKSHH